MNHAQIHFQLTGSGANGATGVLPQNLVELDFKKVAVKFHNMPTGISNQLSLVQTSEEEILLCGGNNRMMNRNVWTINGKNTVTSKVNKDLPLLSPCQEAYSFLEEGLDSKTTWKWLLSVTNQFQSGNTNFPGNGFYVG